MDSMCWLSEALRLEEGNSAREQIHRIRISAMIRQWCFGISHLAINAFSEADGTPIGHYLVHYADGQQREIPILIGQDVDDWFEQPNEDGKRFVVAWTGTNESSRAQGKKIRLFKTTWENPFPAVAVTRIDFVSTKEVVAPFLIANTAEP